VIVAEDKLGGGGQQTRLLQDSFEYFLLPETVKITALTNDRDFMLKDFDYLIEVVT